MRRFIVGISGLVAVLGGSSVETSAQSALAPSPPLGVQDVMRIAAERRDEVAAARARVRAAAARADIASALPDPMLSPSIDHLPFMLNGVDLSVTIEQQFPLSGMLGHRRAAAMADVDIARAEAGRTSLDVAAEAGRAFVMLQERRRMAALVAKQVVLAREIAAAADARYASGTAPQSDVLRAEVEIARARSLERAIAGEVRAAEAMLNVSIGLDAGAAVPDLAPIEFPSTTPAWRDVQRALASRPEIAAGRAEVSRAAAGIDVMRDMFRPMATVRTGPSSTMTDGRGWMAMVGISLPIWRTKLRAGVAEAEAMRAMSEADLRAMVRMIEGEAAVALSRYEAARDRQSALTADVVPRARLAIEPAVAGYAAGRVPLVTVVEAVQALWQVEAELVDAEMNAALARVRLGRAMGILEGVSR